MDAVIETETSLGRAPRDVSSQRGLGYDVESRDPESGILFIEVKGLGAGRDRVTLTKNEILCARNKPDNFVLALVRVGGNQKRELRYLRGHDFGELDFAEECRGYHLTPLWEKASEPV
jgi:hypothetical protein